MNRIYTLEACNNSSCFITPLQVTLYKNKCPLSHQLRCFTPPSPDLRLTYWPEVRGSRPTVQSLSYSRWCLLDTSSACHTSLPEAPSSEPALCPASGEEAGNPPGRRSSQPPGCRRYRGGSSGRDRHSTRPAVTHSTDFSLSVLKNNN